MKTILFAALAVAGFVVSVAQAEHRDIASRRAAERKVFTDAEIADGFFKTAYGAELRVAGRSDRVRKYTGPVRVFIDNRGKPDRSAQVAAVVADIRAHVQHLDIAVTQDRNHANVVVTLVRNRDLASTIVKLHGRERARQIQRALLPQCLSGFHKDETFRITASSVILVVDAGEFLFFDCAYEELLQALGPVNDTKTVPWTMFNDNVQMGFFDIYDQYLLNILYDPRIQPGMNAAEAAALLPQILPDVRAWIEKVNGLGR